MVSLESVMQTNLVKEIGRLYTFGKAEPLAGVDVDWTGPEALP